MVDLNIEFLKYTIEDYGMKDMLKIFQGVSGLHEKSVVLDEDELKDVIKFCVEEGFLEWDCSECPIQ